MKLQNLSYAEGEKLMNAMPKKIKIMLYVNYCSNDQLIKIIDEWIRLKKNDELVLLKKALKKKRTYHIFNNLLKDV